MILFKKDWAEQLAYTHDNTKNKSFIKICLVLKKMGIENYLFPLALYDKTLMDVDPHSKNLSADVQLRIALEARRNHWYFFREIVRVQSSGGEPVPFRLHRGNLAMIWCYMNSIDYFSVQPRQTFKTISACAMLVYVLYIYGRNIEIGLFTKDSDLIQANVARIKVIRDALPKYLIHKQASDTDNKEGLSYTALGNRYVTRVAQSDKQGADNIARGATSPTSHLDELAYITNIDITYPVMMFATTAARKSAKLNNQPHSNLITTTAGRIDTPRGRYAYEIMNDAMPFTEKLYDSKDVDELKTIVRANSKNDMINGTFSFLMLGYDYDWLADVIRLTKATQEEIDRDIFNMWKSGSETGLISAEVLKLMNENKSEPAHIEIISNYVVSWYISKSILESSEFKTRQLILGMDSSENIGRDFTALVLIDAKDMSVVATFRCNESNTLKMGLFIADFLMKYTNVLFIPERKSTGGAIVDIIIMAFKQKNMNPLRRIFNKIVQERDTEEMKKIRLDDPGILDTSIRRHIGFITTGNTREILYKQILTKAVTMNATRIYDNKLITEISTLSTVKGRIDHSAGNHDDMVIAYLLACYVVYNGMNLHEYGMRSNQILSGVIQSTGESVDPIHREYQINLRKQIKHYESLAHNAEPILANTFRAQASALKEFIDEKMMIEPISVEKVSSDTESYSNIYSPKLEEPKKNYDSLTILNGLVNMF